MLSIGNKTKNAAAAGSNASRRWWILALLGTAQLMVVLDATIVNIALPSAQQALGFSADNRQWVVTAYALAFGSLLLVGGRIGDLFGRKPAFIAGLTGFALASAMGGAAQSFGMLVAARALQGAFAALLAPAALSLLSTTFTDAKERGTAFGIYGAIAGGGGAVGLLLGGVLTEYVSWRWNFYVNLAIAIPAALVALALLPARREPARSRIDWPGTLTASAGLFALVYGFSNAETHSWGSPTTIASIAVGVLLLVSFAAIERRVEHPLLPMRVVLDRNRGGSYLALAISGAGIFGVFLFLTFYMQQTLGFSPVKTGLAFLPMIGALTATATVGNSRLLTRLGPRPIMTSGMLLASGAMVLLAQVGVASTYATDVLPGLVVVGAGLGLVISPALNIGTLGVNREDAGVASAMVSTMQQVGGSVGTALLSTLATGATTSYLASHAPAAGAAAEAAVTGYTTAFWWAAAIFALGSVVTMGLLRRGAPEIAPDAEPVLA